MLFSPPLLSALFRGRYKRFFADIELPDGSELTIHCPNTGSMKHCLESGRPCWYSRSDKPGRKLPGTLELVTTAGERLAGVNTTRANHLVSEAIDAGVVSELVGYERTRREVRYGAENSRIDLLLERGDERCYVEVKSVTLEGPNQSALFPDAPTARGRKHLRELIGVVEGGQRSVLLFCVQLSGVERIGVAAEIDPEYAATLKQAREAGVEVLAYGCKLCPEQIVIRRRLPLVL